MRVWALACVISASATPVAADGEAAALFYGTSDAGATVRLAGSEAELPARLFPCANCHGADGEGGVEGTLFAPPIAGRGLSAEMLARAAEEGLGSDGEPLDRTMPRYALPGRGAAELAAFLDELPVRERAGVTGSTVRIAVLGVEADPFRQGLMAAVEGKRAWGRAIIVDAGEEPGAFLGASLDGTERRGLPVIAIAAGETLSPEAAGRATGEVLLAALRGTGRNLTRSRVMEAFRDLGGNTAR